MAVIYHTFGPCVPYVSLGVADAMIALGNSAKPGGIREMFEHEPRQMDGAGKVPADFQMMGHTALITLDLGSWDDTVMASAKSRSTAAGAIGAFLALGGHAFGLYLPSATDLPWYFPCVKLEEPGRQPGHKSDDHTVRFFAWKPMGPTGTTTSGTALYTRAAP